MLAKKGIAPPPRSSRGVLARHGDRGQAPSEQPADFLFERVRRNRRRETSRDPALSIDKEFCEIPFDRLGSQNPLGFAFEKPVERMGPRAIDLDLVKHGKCHIIGERTKSRDFGRITRFLPAKLVAWKAQNGKTLGMIFTVLRL